MYESGVHAAITGVMLGLLTPFRPNADNAAIEKLEVRMHPWSSFVVVPAFALANAGVRLSGSALDHASTSAITVGIVLGLVLGKPIGIFVATALGVRFRLGQLPEGVRLPDVVAAGVIAGIGFTVSLFVADLAFGATRLQDAKIGIVVASLFSGLAGAALLFGRANHAIAAPPDTTGRSPQTD